MLSPPPPERFLTWYAALEQRHLQALTFPEVRRALVALSSIYVERRDRLQRGAALDGAGKRAAFALFYGPLHFLTATFCLHELTRAAPRPTHIIDLGCGTGVAGAAWALDAGGTPRLLGIDENRWALGEARWTWQHFGLSGEARVGDATAAVDLGGAGTAVVLAYTVNELEPKAAAALLERLLKAARAGAQILVLEPIARRDKPILHEWERAFLAAGGASNEWAFRTTLPERLRLLDKAAGLRHDVLKARTLYLGQKVP